MKLTPYRQVAKQAFKNWYEKTEDEAMEIVLNEKFENIEKGDGSPRFGINEWWGVSACSSMKAAIDIIADKAELSENRREEFADVVFAKDDVTMDLYHETVFRFIAARFNIDRIDLDVIDILSAVHDVWVSNYSKKFMEAGREHKRYQHLPIELIGFEQAKLDLLFVEPILDALGIKVSEEELSAAYDNHVAKFFCDNKLKDKETLKNYILNIDEHYSPIDKYNNPKNTENPEEVAKQMADQVIDKLPVNMKKEVKSKEE